MSELSLVVTEPIVEQPAEPEVASEVAAVAEPPAKPARPPRVSGYLRKKFKISRLTAENEQLRQRVTVLEMALAEVDRRINSRPLTPSYPGSSNHEFNYRNWRMQNG